MIFQNKILKVKHQDILRKLNFRTKDAINLEIKGSHAYHQFTLKL